MGCFLDDDGDASLHCEDSQWIYIENSTYGRSAPECTSTDICCPTSTICMTDAESDHMQWLRNECNGKQSCLIGSLYIGAGYCRGDYTDYESITYICSTEAPSKYATDF